jgi:hypothetical protein
VNEAEIMDRLEEEISPFVEEISYHEAGHAVAAFLITDAKFEGIKIDAIENYAFVSPQNDATPDKKTRTPMIIPEITTQIIILCSGDVAEFLYNGHKCGHDETDNYYATKLLSKVCPGEKIPAYIEEIWNIALKLLKQPPNWFAVGQLAEYIQEARTEPQDWNGNELAYDCEYVEENRELDGDQVRKIIIESFELYYKLQKREKVYYREPT